MCALWLAASLAACADDEASCDLATIVPGLGEVVAAPREDVIAETLALACGDGIGAPRALYEALVDDLDTIAAVDERMRLEPIPELQVYGYWSRYAHPPSFVAEDEALADARALLDDETCAARVAGSLHGAAREHRTVTGREQVILELAPRLHPTVVIRTFASVGVTLRPYSMAAGDGSRAQFRNVAGGREWLLQLRGGDCPAGCTVARSFWWRVAGGEATLLGEWGGTLGSPSPGEYDPAPEGFDPAGFACGKCPDGRATRATEATCDDGDDDDCDDLIDCADPDCAGTTSCG